MKLAVKTQNQANNQNTISNIVEDEHSIKLVCGQSSIELQANGTIIISGKKIVQQGSENLKLTSEKIELN